MVRPISGVKQNMHTFWATPMLERAPAMPMGSVGPYTLMTWLNTMPTRVPATCMAKDATPREVILRHSFSRGLRHKMRRRNGVVSLAMKYHSTGMAPNSWPITVARALPGTPIPMTMTKM